MTMLKLISDAFGVLYVGAWSISFYPPLFLNYQLRSTEGLSTDFLAFNIVGYTALLTSMLLFLYNSNVRQLYHDIHGYYPLLTGIDLIYSAHGFLLTMVTISQLFFWGFKKRSLALKKITKTIITLILLITIFLYCNVGTKNLHELTGLDAGDEVEATTFTLLEFATILSYVKILMSLIKYIPQLTHNYRRRSILGFSIFTIFLDYTGGILSIAQLFLDAYIATGTLSYDILINNGGKLGLSFVTLFFDSCFIYQWWLFEKYPTTNIIDIDKKDYRELP